MTHRVVACVLLLATSTTGADFAGSEQSDTFAALREVRTLAEQGQAKAQTALGVMYEYGLRTSESYAQAARWYRRAAEQGYARGQYHLGVMYANGRGVPEDDHQAVFWYRKAADQGDVHAQTALGVMYAEGLGVREDDRQAVFWYRRAAERGDADAQAMLGIAYFLGQGVPEDYVRGYAWLNLGASRVEAAKQARDRVRQFLDSTQIAEAHKLGRQLDTRIASRNQPAPASLHGNPVRLGKASSVTVRQVQVYLAMLGYGPDRTDGLPSERTTAAVRWFQQELGVTLTGEISEELLVLLRAMATASPREPAEAESSGSGFRVGRNGDIVTNQHVVDGCTRVTVNSGGRSHDASVQAVEPSDDLALLTASPDLGEAATFSESPRASLGEAVMVAGYPLQGVLATEFNVTTGNVSALAGPDDAKRLQLTAPVQLGNSGGPVLDHSGNVVGMVVGKLNAVGAAKLTGDIPQNVNFAVKGAVVRGFLDIHGVAYGRRPSNARLTSERIAELARSFTVAVHCWK